MSEPSQGSAPVAAPPSPPPARKGLPALAWVAIGCGVLAVIAVVMLTAGGFFVAKMGRDLARDFEKDPAMAAAETLVKLNPELELVESDREAKTLTIRNKKTDEVLTVDLADVESGHIGFRTDEGEMAIEAHGEGEGAGLTVTKGGEEALRVGAGSGDVPDWVPTYPGGTPVGVYSAATGDQRGGAFQLSTDAGVGEVLDFYRERLEAAGFEVQRTETSGPQGPGGSVTGEDSAAGRTVAALVMVQEGKTLVIVNFSERSE